MSLQHFQGYYRHPALHHQFCLYHFQGCRISPNRIRHLQPRPSTHCPNRPPNLTKLAPAMPANGAANDTMPSAPPPSKHPSKTRRMNPQLLVQPLAQYRTPASRKNATAPQLPRTLSITSVPCLPNPTVSSNAHTRAHHPFLIRFTIGGKVSTPTADLETIKILLNSTVSTPNAKMLTANIEIFYLGTPMDCYKYMRIPAKDIPADLMEQYNLAPLVHNGHVLTKIRKGMYGLPQAGILAYNRLVQHLALSDYTPVKHTLGLFRHATRPVTFLLVVDDFAIKYVDRANAEHLLATLWSLYSITTDWTASMYCGITLK